MNWCPNKFILFIFLIFANFKLLADGSSYTSTNLYVAASNEYNIEHNLIRLKESLPGLKKIQTRTFTVLDESSSLTAALSMLQDMDYIVDQTDTTLGIITANKVKNVFYSKHETNIEKAFCYYATLGLFGSCDYLDVDRIKYKKHFNFEILTK